MKNKKEKREEKLLKLWKARQQIEGRDVSKVKTLKEAETFYKKKTTTKKRREEK